MSPCLTPIILDVRKNRRERWNGFRRLSGGVVRQRERLDRIDEAFLHERSIDRQTYERQRDQLREQVALAEIELNDAVLDQLDIDGVLAFAEQSSRTPRAFGWNSISFRNSGFSRSCFLKDCGLTGKMEPP